MENIFTCLRIFSSEAYFDEHLAVFHAMYILDCLKQDTCKTALGDYFLPPKELHEGKFSTCF